MTPAVATERQVEADETAVEPSDDRTSSVVIFEVSGFGLNAIRLIPHPTAQFITFAPDNSFVFTGGFHTGFAMLCELEQPAFDEDPYKLVKGDKVKDFDVNLEFVCINSESALRVWRRSPRTARVTASRSPAAP